jgi:hypothetical protein
VDGGGGVRWSARPGMAIYSREEGFGDLSRSGSMRARAPATYAVLAWLLAGEEMGEGRALNAREDEAGGRRRTARHSASTGRTGRR